MFQLAVPFVIPHVSGISTFVSGLAACGSTDSRLGTQSNWNNWMELVFCKITGQGYADSQMQSEVTATARFPWLWSNGKAVYI